MLQNFNKYFVFLLFTLSILQGCIVPKFPQITDITDVRLIEKNDSMVQGLVDVWIYNPNYFAFTVKSITYKAFVNKQFLGQGQLDTIIKFPPKQKVFLDNQSVTIYYRDLDKIIRSLPSLDSFPVTFKLKAKLKGIIFPIYWQKTLYLDTQNGLSAFINWNNVPKFLQFRDFQIISTGITQTVLKLSFVFKNAYPISFTIDTVKINLFDKYGNLLGTSQLTNEQIKAYSDQNLDFVFNINNIQMAISLLGQYIEQDLIFWVKGYITITIKNSTFKLPINEKIEAKIQHIENDH